ncbi:unnamed protein product [Lathyrus sativus]|nr:unnamed protein product [Lathyrus sativus]
MRSILSYSILTTFHLKSYSNSRIATEVNDAEACQIALARFKMRSAYQRNKDDANECLALDVMFLYARRVASSGGNSKFLALRFVTLRNLTKFDGVDSLRKNLWGESARRIQKKFC